MTDARSDRTRRVRARWSRQFRAVLGAAVIPVCLVALSAAPHGQSGDWHAPILASFDEVWQTVNDTFYDPPPAGEPGEPLAPEEDQPGTIAKRQLSMMHAKFAALGITDRSQRLAWTEQVVGRVVGSASELSHREAGALLEALAAEARERSKTT